MINPLSPEEKELVFEMLAMCQQQRKQPESMMKGEAVGDMEETAVSRLDNASILIEAGLHNIALEEYGDLLETTDRSYMQVKIGVAAYLADDLVLARTWADHAFTQLGLLLDRSPAPVWEYGQAPLTEVLRLAKLYLLLGDPEKGMVLRSWARPLVVENDLHQDDLFDCLRLAVELAWEEEARLLLPQLHPIIPGHSRGNLWHRCFLSLFEKGQVHFAWAIIGMTREDHGLLHFHGTAIEVAVAMGRYELALAFACLWRGDDKWSGLQTLARSLVEQGRVSDWEGIWDSLYNESNRGPLFWCEDQLKFLAMLVAHVSEEDRLKILTFAKKMDSPIESSINKALAQRVHQLCCVVYAWAEDAAVLQGMQHLFEVSNDFHRTTLRAVLSRGLDFLEEQVVAQCWPNLATSQSLQFALEYERMLAGQTNEMEALLAKIKEQVITHKDTRLLSSVGSMLCISWKDEARYIGLMEDVWDAISTENTSHYLFLLTLARRYDLPQLHQWMERLVSFELDPWLFHDTLRRYLKVRIGMSDRIADF